MPLNPAKVTVSCRSFVIPLLPQSGCLLSAVASVIHLQFELVSNASIQRKQAEAAMQKLVFHCKCKHRVLPWQKGNPFPPMNQAESNSEAFSAIFVSLLREYDTVPSLLLCGFYLKAESL